MATWYVCDVIYIVNTYRLYVDFFFLRTLKRIIRNQIKDLPFNMCTLTDVGLALDGSHVYKPESLCSAFCINNRLVVSTPFSVTNEIPPRGESKLICCNKIEYFILTLNFILFHFHCVFLLFCLYYI